MPARFRQLTLLAGRSGEDGRSSQVMVSQYILLTKGLTLAGDMSHLVLHLLLNGIGQRDVG